MGKVVVLIRNAASSDFGGAERFPTLVADVLKDIGYTPIVASGNKSVRKFADSHGIKAKATPWWSNQNWSGVRALLVPIYMLWQLLLTLYYLVYFMSVRPLAVHIQSKDDFIAATFAGKLAGANVVWNDHADLKHIWLNVGVWYKNPVGKLVYGAAKFTDVIIVASKSEIGLISANLKSSSFVHDKIQLMYNGCNDAYNALGHNKFDVFTYCIANRLVTDKGLGETIEAFKKIHAEHADTRLLILGDGPEKDRFLQLANDNESIEFVGHQDNPYESMAQSHVFLQPSYHDAFSVVIVEASMLGLPIIATSIGGNVEIIFDRETGLLVPAKDSEALYEAMKLLKTDDELRNQLAEAARKNYLDHFVFKDIISSTLVNLYEGKRPESQIRKEDA